MRAMLIFLLSLFALPIMGQDGAEIIRLVPAAETVASTHLERAVEAEIGQWFGATSDSQVHVITASNGGYQHSVAARDSAEALPSTLTIDLNAWRREIPDRFVPGPLNAIFGSVGLADTRRFEILIRNDEEGSDLVLRYESRKDGPGDELPHEFTLARLDLAELADAEFWEFERLGPSWFVRFIVQAGLALESGDRHPTDHRFADRWLRGRSSLLKSLDRSVVRTGLLVTDSASLGVVYWFDPAIGLSSLEGALRRLAVDEQQVDESTGWVVCSLSAVTIEDSEIRPVVMLGSHNGQAVAILAATMPQCRVVQSKLTESSE